MKELAKQYDPSQVEDRIYQFWLDGGYFHTKADPDKKPYTIVMPPPNVTGQLHMGHALDNTLPAVQALKAGETISDVFIYTVSDGRGQFVDATLTIVITGTNDAPLVQPDTNTIVEDSPSPATGSVLLNDRDPDNGAVLWEAPLAAPRGTNDVERLVDLVGPSTRNNDVVCARAYQASVGCVDVGQARLMWTAKATGAVGIASNAEQVFGSESNGTVQAWSRRDGSKQWSTQRLQLRQLTAPLALGRSVVVGDSSGLVHMLSKDDGTPLNRLTTDSSGIAATPVVVADTLVVLTRNGGVYGFRPD